MKKFISKLHYKKYLSPFECGVLCLLLPFSCCYAVVSEGRNLLYKLNILKTKKPGAYCISIGNLTTGGVGKTPIVKEIANYFTSKGKKVAILSRGYGSKLSPKDIHIISDGKDVLYNARQAGDEPYWLAQNCPGTSVLTCSDRVEIAKYATNKLHCNILILDDGYQHQKLGRDLNILVVDYEKQFGNKLLLPAGPLREPVYHVSRADKIIVVNKTFNIIEANAYCEKLRKKHNKKVFAANMEFEKIYSLMSNMEVKKPKKLLAFCAIGQPEQFFDQIKENELDLVCKKAFPDHHSYTMADMIELSREADANHCTQLITTEKDAVKIKQLFTKNTSIDKEILVVKLKTTLDLDELFDDVG